MSLLSDKIQALALTGTQDVADILRLITAPTVTEATVTETVDRPAKVYAMEQAAIEAILDLATRIQPGMTLAQVQAAPMTTILTMVRGKFATLGQADGLTLLAQVGELQTLYAAIAAAGGYDWRSPEFGAQTRSVARTVRTEGPSWWQANHPDQPEPTLHDIRQIMKELNL